MTAFGNAEEEQTTFAKYPEVLPWSLEDKMRELSEGGFEPAEPWQSKVHWSKGVLTGESAFEVVEGELMGRPEPRFCRRTGQEAQGDPAGCLSDVEEVKEDMPGQVGTRRSSNPNVMHSTYIPSGSLQNAIDIVAKLLVLLEALR